MSFQNIYYVLLKYIKNPHMIISSEDKILLEQWNDKLINIIELLAICNFDLIEFIKRETIGDIFKQNIKLNIYDLIKILQKYYNEKGTLNYPEGLIYDLRHKKSIMLTNEILNLGKSEREIIGYQLFEEKKRQEEIKKALEMLNKEKSELIDDGDEFDEKLGNVLSDGELYYPKFLPEYLFKKEWVLIDIQETLDRKYFIFVFRNSETGKKVLKKVSKRKFDYYYVLKNKNEISYPIVDVKKTICKKGYYENKEDKEDINKYRRTIYYDARYSNVTKAAIDYYVKAEEDDNYLPRVFRFDIEHEVRMDSRISIEGDKRITFISAEYEDKYFLWVLESDELNVYKKQVYKDYTNKERELYVFEFKGNESLMLQHFWYVLLAVLDPDIITAWNNNKFDFPYLINRSKKLVFEKGYDYPFCKFDCYYVIDIIKALGREYYVDEIDSIFIKHYLMGIIVADLMEMYSEQQQNSVESLALNYIAELELGLQKKYILWETATKQEWIEYNLWDTELLELLDEKLQITNFRFFLTKIAKNTWHKVAFPLGIVEGLLYYYAKRNGVVLRDCVQPETYGKFLDEIQGGFTQTNDGGIFEWLVDFDAKSMYPTIMLSCNIGPNTLRLTVSPEVAFKIITRNYDENEKVKIYPSEMFYYNGRQMDFIYMTFKELVNEIKQRKYIVTMSGAIYASHDEEKTFFFEILENINNERDLAKKTMYEEGKLNVAKYNRQLALKKAANSFYGVYLYKKFMFYNTTIGASVSMTGRLFLKSIINSLDDKLDSEENIKDEKIEAEKDVLLKMKSLDIMKQQDLKLKYIIYGDTDGFVITLNHLLSKQKNAIVTDKINYLETIAKDISKKINKIVYEIYKLINFGEVNEKLMLKFKEEWIARRGLFYCQKHKCYILYILKEEGKLVEKIIYKGIQLKRSDTPKIVKEYLEEIVKDIMTNEENGINLNNVKKKLNEIENKLKEILIKERTLLLAKSVSFSKPLSEYKNMPQNIKAMIFWNVLHDVNYFRVGSKGYMYNIKGIDFEQFKKLNNKTDEEIKDIILKHNLQECDVIAIPQDFDKVPDYIILDVETIIEKRYRETYRCVFEPILGTSTDNLCTIGFGVTRNLLFAEG